MSSLHPVRRSLAVLLITAAAAGGSAAAQEPAAPAAPPAAAPAQSTAPAESATSGTLTPAKAERIFEERVRRNPRDYYNATLLGRVRLKLAKSHEDAAMYIRAEEALRHALSIKPDHTPAQTYLAIALVAQHRFSDARDVLEPLIHSEPDNLLALATFGDVMLETGQYDRAGQVYQQLAELAPEAPAMLARLAHLAELRGNATEAESLIRRALETVTADAAEPEERAWFAWRLGGILFARGDFEGAWQQHAPVLSEDAGYEPSIAGMALVCAAQGKLDEAIEHQRRAVAITPDLHGWWVLGDLYTRQGRTAEATEAYGRAEAAGANQPDLNRLLAHFYADRNIKLDDALRLITADLKQRQDVHGYDVLAWVHYRAGRLNDAADAIARATSLGTHVASVQFHAGMIHLARGEHDQSRAALNRALAINAAFSVLDAAAARQTLVNLDIRK